MAVGDAYVFPSFLTPVLTQLFFPKPPTTFLTCFCRGERRKYAGKKSRLNRGSNSQPPGHESDTLTTEPFGRSQSASNGDYFFFPFNPFPNKPWFLRVCSTSLLKTLREKGEIARNEQFLLFPTVFCILLETVLPFSSNSNLSSAISSKLEDPKNLSFGKGKKHL